MLSATMVPRACSSQIYRLNVSLNVPNLCMKDIKSLSVLSCPFNTLCLLSCMLISYGVWDCLGEGSGAVGWRRLTGRSSADSTLFAAPGRTAQNSLSVACTLVVGHSGERRGFSLAALGLLWFPEENSLGTGSAGEGGLCLTGLLRGRESQSPAVRSRF